MASEFALITAGNVRAWSDHARTFKPVLSAGQIAALAAFANVSYRTAERWFTLAGQRRNLVQRSTIGHTRDDLPVPSRNRVLLGQALLEGIERFNPYPGKIEEYRVRFGAMADCWRYCVELYDGGIDPFLAAAWVEMHIEYDDGEQLWRVIILYSRQKGRTDGPGGSP